MLNNQFITSSFDQFELKHLLGIKTLFLDFITYINSIKPALLKPDEGLVTAPLYGLVSILIAISVLILIKRIRGNKPRVHLSPVFGKKTASEDAFYVWYDKLDPYAKNLSLLLSPANVRSVNIKIDDVQFKGFINNTLLYPLHPTLFMFIPEELLNVANILALIFFNL